MADKILYVGNWTMKYNCLDKQDAEELAQKIKKAGLFDVRIKESEKNE